VPSDGASVEALVQPAPNPMPAPYVINQPTTHNTEPFSFGSQVDLICPKLLHDTIMSYVLPCTKKKYFAQVFNRE
jgi:hypothetical protein